MAAKKPAKTEKAAPVTGAQEEKLKALEHALADLDKQFGKGAVMKLGEHAEQNVQVIPTGCLTLDEALGVGGLFADTVDTLVGSGMLVQSALGVTGLIVIASRAVLPLCQTLAAAMLYKLASALMQPVSDGSLAGCIHDFAKVLMLLFVLQLSAAAMYLMLIAQLIAVSGFTMMLR